MMQNKELEETILSLKKGIKYRDKEIATLEIERDYWEDKAERYAEELPEDFINI